MSKDNQWKWRKISEEINSTYLILQNQNEDVISSHSKHKERYDLQNDQWGRKPNPGIETHRGHDRAAHDQNTTQTNQELWIYLRKQEYDQVKLGQFICNTSGKALIC